VAPSASSGSVVVPLIVLGLIALGMSGESLGDDDAGTDEAGTDEATQSGSEDAGTCDDVVIVQSASGESDVPGNVTQVESTASAECGLSEGDDDEAVRALQEALVTCNGQDIAVDGEYGPQTREAVARVQEANGLVADGTYGPPTRDAMLWPTSTSGTTTCVSDVQSSTASDPGG
jgi:peptidoglycan hydrolase-like protein with peptidoglycan-binding domain